MQLVQQQVGEHDETEGLADEGAGPYARGVVSECGEKAAGAYESEYGDGKCAEPAVLLLQPDEESCDEEGGKDNDLGDGDAIASIEAVGSSHCAPPNSRC